ncbi:MAG TPA: hypothetical protein PK129_15950 [Cellvibrionaceae bacterium]|nr:hypothetical protein [Cellvibrionaceae bacterium]
MNSSEKLQIDTIIRYAINIVQTHEKIIAPLRYRQIQGAKSGLEYLDRELLNPLVAEESKSYIREQQVIHAEDIAKLKSL